MNFGYFGYFGHVSVKWTLDAFDTLDMSFSKAASSKNTFFVILIWLYFNAVGSHEAEKLT